MRKRFLLKLSLRTLDQLKALIFVCPCRDEDVGLFSSGLNQNLNFILLSEHIYSDHDGTSGTDLKDQDTSVCHSQA